MPAERTGPEDEKVTVNLGPVDLGHIDLLVREGLYASRTDFIRDAIRRGLDVHRKLVDDVVARKEFQVGFLSHNRGDLERVVSAKRRLQVKVIGVYRLADDIDLQLAQSALDRVTVLGALRGPKPVTDWVRTIREVD